LTSLDEISSEDVVSLRLEMEKLGQRVRNQDANILQLQKHIQQVNFIKFNSKHFLH